MLKIKIKASDITSLTDARYFAAKEVEWLSFNFTEGVVGYIQPMKARAIFEWVEGVKIVGEFNSMTADEINFYTEGWSLQAVQVGHFTPIEEVLKIKTPGNDSPACPHRESQSESPAPASSRPRPPTCHKR